MDKKQYKRIDWSKLSARKQTIHGCTNGNRFEIAINVDENSQRTTMQKEKISQAKK